MQTTSCKQLNLLFVLLLQLFQQGSTLHRLRTLSACKNTVNAK